MTNVNGNLLTEAEASRRWCPFASQIVPGGNAANRTVKGVGCEGTKCLGSVCMAWRWDHATEGNYGSCGLAGAVGKVVVAK